MKEDRMSGTIADDRSAESRRILDRVARESDGSSPTLLGRTATRTRDHLSAADVDPSDRIELWGTRIGRIIGGIALVAMVLWALSMLTSGA
jgi:hypothetical protein